MNDTAYDKIIVCVWIMEVDCKIVWNTGICHKSSEHLPFSYDISLARVKHFKYFTLTPPQAG